MGHGAMAPRAVEKDVRPPATFRRRGNQILEYAAVIVRELSVVAPRKGLVRRRLLVETALKHFSVAAFKKLEERAAALNVAL